MPLDVLIIVGGSSRVKTSKEVTLLETILHRVDVALQSRKCHLGDITEDFIGRLNSGIAVVG